MSDIAKPDIYFSAGKIWVTPKIWNNNLNKISSCMMLFDTGATMTTIDVSIANRAGISLKDAIPITTHGVGGSVSGYLVMVKEFWFGNLNLGTIAAHVIPFNKDSEVQAVLGMNVLKNFKTTIDLLHKADGSDGAIFLEPTFDLAKIDTLDTFTLNESRFGIWSV